LLGTQSKLKVENKFAWGINVPLFTDWHTGAALVVWHRLPSIPHCATVFSYTA
jgi:hypothetical protein